MIPQCFKKLCLRFTIGILFIATAQDLLADNGIVKKKYVEELEQTHYSYEADKCSVTLIVYDPNSINSRVLHVRRSCSRDWIEQVGLIGVLLSELKLDGKLSSVDTISWGQISEKEIRTRLAEGAMESQEWESIAEDKKTKFSKDIPEVADILNDTLAFHELIKLAESMGYNLSVKSTDGVLVGGPEAIREFAGFSIPVDMVLPYTANVWFRIESITQ